MASHPLLPRAGRMRQIGWLVVLGIAFSLFLALTFHVNAVKSEVRLAERQIIALERQKMMLETEFQTRASQRQLANWNAVEFGYSAPRANQYLEGRRQLAKLGTPRAPGAPEPIRVAMASSPVEDPGFLSRWDALLAQNTAVGDGDAVPLQPRSSVELTDLTQRLTRGATMSGGARTQAEGAQ
ncbi:hypothetical protein ACRAQ7_01450 [Erythrobacter sp. W53]|uniref:hypothetical protein n=1 Tax=Erythrobacter sp. W53 TaxID=3425947 RepID=UPI003D7671AF